MARLDSYPLDPIAEGDDKILATDKDGVVTKNLTVTSVVNYVNSVRGGGYPISAKDGTELLLAVWPDGRVEAIPKDSTAPNITSLPIITGTLNVGETLTVTPGTFTGLPEPTTVLQWQRSDDGLTGWADIAGATSVSYLLGFNDEDKYIRVQQTEENILGTATSNSVSTGQIQPASFVGLLDEYPNAAGAYSLRKLRALYSGSAVRVTTNGADGADIGFINNELDTATLEAFANGGDAYVSTWYDQSGNSKNATQSTLSQMPQIVDNGSTILENGKPAISLTGVNATGFATSLTGSSIFDFYAVTNANSNIQYILPDNATISETYYGYIARNQASPTLYLNYGTPSLYVNGNFETPATRIDVQALIATGNDLLQVHQGADTSAWSYIEFFRRFGFPMSGTAKEIVIYNTDQSGNRSGIETNINDFYNIY